ncbi:carboxypeptidase M32 [Clostridia bacterium]|nr:carboxypeptidase M32 [Clostridia bacterium]
MAEYDSKTFKSTTLYAITDKMWSLNIGASMLSWDMHTGAPEGGNESRAKALAALSSEAFALSISDEMKRALEELEDVQDNLDEITAAAVRICRKNYDSTRKIPIEEMRAYQELTANAETIWRNAKQKNDFAAFAPTLTQIIAYNKRFTTYRGFTGNPYNTLLDDYEPGMTTDELDAFFAKVKATIVPLLKRITEAKKKIDTSFVNRPISVKKQKKLAALLIEKIGFDLTHGQIRESAHPFTTSFGRNDVRITTHYYETEFLSSFYSVIHECGHGIYGQGIMDGIVDTILDNGISMGIGESQSRFYENMIGRSLSFWELIYPELMAIVGDEFKDITAKQFYEAANSARASLIRVEADELTYSLHVIIRYEIEKLLINGEIDVMELPRIWNEKYQEYLGITPPDDSRGVLQDVHWSAGMFGYFPSYSLGNAYGAQILATMEKDLDLKELIRSGNIGKITAWLRERIHRYGSIKIPSDLIRAISGEALNADYYVRYLTDKFEALYEL